MFDKLVESASTGAELRPRRTIFAASFFFVALLFASVVLASIYAADFDLGNNNFDLAQLLTPMAETEPPAEPEPARQQQQTNQANPNPQTSRVLNILRIDENPIAPTAISTEPSKYLSRPIGPFILDSKGTDGNGPPPESYSSGPPIGSTSSSASILPTEPEPVEKDVPPPAPRGQRPPPIKSEGVINGKATHLPKPVYSAAAIAMRAQGAVNVQVTIDEEGKVISAKAVSGNPLLKVEAERAAWKARFTSTYLSKVPVKVTGVIVYNFTKN